MIKRKGKISIKVTNQIF